MVYEFQIGTEEETAIILEEMVKDGKSIQESEIEVLVGFSYKIQLIMVFIFRI